MTRIIIVSDAWHPQVNGVVRSIEMTSQELDKMGFETVMITPQLFRSFPCPSYPEIRLSLCSARSIGKKIEAAQPAFVHIATEGPLGYAARAWCRRKGMPFSTSYHTRFPEYVAARYPIPLTLLYGIMRRFHNAGSGCMVATQSLENDLAAHGFKNLMRWSRGIDGVLFHPREKQERPFGLPRPIFMTVGRVAIEKNLPAFLDLDLPGSKVVVGDGPDLEKLKAHYPDVHFTGVKFGEELAAAYAEADVFVFPSKTDTFGNTILEALASGVPVAAYPVMGPIDIIGEDPRAGALNDDLRQACLEALPLKGEDAHAHSEAFTWEAATRQFLDNVFKANGIPPSRRFGLFRRRQSAESITQEIPASH